MMPTGWNDFFVAVAGASAALSGLLFVALAISLSRISNLPARGFESMSVLLSLLVASLFALVPGQSAFTLGLELALTAFASWAIQVIALIRHWNGPPSHARNPLRLLLNQFPSAPMMVAGVLHSQGDASGAYWIVPAVILSFATAFLAAWIMLVEVPR